MLCVWFTKDRVYSGMYERRWAVWHVSVLVHKTRVKKYVGEIMWVVLTKMADADILNGNQIK